MALFLLLLTSNPGRRNCHKHISHPTFDVGVSEMSLSIHWFKNKASKHLHSSWRWDGFLHNNFPCSLENTYVENFSSICLSNCRGTHGWHRFCRERECSAQERSEPGRGEPVHMHVSWAGVQRPAQLGETLQTAGPASIHPALKPKWAQRATAQLSVHLWHGTSPRIRSAEISNLGVNN